MSSLFLHVIYEQTCQSDFYVFTVLLVIHEQTYKFFMCLHCSYLLYMSKHISVIFMSSKFVFVIYKQTLSE